MRADRELREGLAEHFGFDKTKDDLDAEARDRAEQAEIYEDILATLQMLDDDRDDQDQDRFDVRDLFDDFRACVRFDGLDDDPFDQHGDDHYP